MATKDTDRFNDTIKYIEDHVSLELANHIKTIIGAGEREATGKLLSLSGLGYWHEGTKDQHRAVRALVLCHKAYLTTRWAENQFGAKFNYNGAPTLAQTFFRDKSEGAVQRALDAYVKLPNPNRADIAAAAKDIKYGAEKNIAVNLEVLARDSNPYPAVPVCFDALKWWLFKAGFVSLRWVVTEGTRMTAQTVNGILGDGVIVAPGKESDIKLGYLVNFHGDGRKDICHWAVSLGDGWARGANNSPGDKGVETDFRDSGNMRYGEFKISSMREVYTQKASLVKTDFTNRKESTASTALTAIVRSVDPTIVATYM